MIIQRMNLQTTKGVNVKCSAWSTRQKTPCHMQGAALQYSIGGGKENFLFAYLLLLSRKIEIHARRARSLLRARRR